MQYQIQYSPSYSLGIISLNPGEAIQAEGGAMVSMTDTIKMTTAAQGGMFAGLRRSMLGGESFFINTFVAEAPGEVTIAPALPGDIVGIELQNQTIFVQSGSFLAATAGITTDTKWGGAKGFFSREGLFLLRCTGTGTLWASSYGAIRQIDIGPAMGGYVVDTGHMVAFDETVQYNVQRVGGWKQTLFSGEGLICRLGGHGRFYLQTRSPDALIDWLVPKLPTRRE